MNSAIVNYIDSYILVVGGTKVIQHANEEIEKCSNTTEIYSLKKDEWFEGPVLNKAR